MYADADNTMITYVRDMSDFISNVMEMFEQSQRSSEDAIRKSIRVIRDIIPPMIDLDPATVTREALLATGHVQWSNDRALNAIRNRDIQLTKARTTLEKEATFLEAVRVFRAARHAAGNAIPALAPKLRGLIDYVTAHTTCNTDARFLLFSRTDTALRTVAAVFATETGLRASYLEGNVHAKSKTLREFVGGTNGLCALLLNIDDHATGLDLPHVTHVLLLDPAPTDAHGATYAQEQQAIGRACRQGQKHTVTVVRFYLKDTYEDPTTSVVVY